MTAEDRGSAYRRCSEGLLYRHWSMDHTHAHPAQDGSESLNRMAVRATLHCLTGCAIGEVLGMVIATALGWGNAASITLSIVLAFLFGYALTFGPDPAGRRTVPSRSGADVRVGHRLDHDDGNSRNAFILIVPGAIAAGLYGFVVLVEFDRQPCHRIHRDRAREPLADRARSWPRGRASVPLSGVITVPVGPRPARVAVISANWCSVGFVFSQVAPRPAPRVRTTPATRPQPERDVQWGGVGS